jgi:hypothetical protein
LQLLLAVQPNTAAAQLRTPGFDNDIMINLQEHRTPQQTGFFLFMSNHLDYGNIGVPAGLLVGGIISNDKAMRQNALYVASSTAISAGLTQLIKVLVKRPRPFIQNIHITPVYRAGGYSFHRGIAHHHLPRPRLYQQLIQMVCYSSRILMGRINSLFQDVPWRTLPNRCSYRCKPWGGKCFADVVFEEVVMTKREKYGLTFLTTNTIEGYKGYRCFKEDIDEFSHLQIISHMDNSEIKHLIEELEKALTGEYYEQYFTSDGTEADSVELNYPNIIINEHLTIKMIEMCELLREWFAFKTSE